MGIDPTRFDMRKWEEKFNPITVDEEKQKKVTVPIGKEGKVQPKEQTVEDEVRSDLGLELGNTQKPDGNEEVAQTQETQEVAKADEAKQVEEETPVKDEETSKEPAKELKHAEPLTVEQVQEQIMFEGNDVKLKTQRKYINDDVRKNRITEMKDKFLHSENEDIKGLTDEQAQKMAEDYVKNEERLENFYSTRTFTDKKEYKAAKKEYKAAKKDHYKELREQGLSRREARKQTEEWAKQNLVNNERLKNKGAKKYVEAHPEKFKDENGNFSQAKYKQFCEELMNTHTEENETRNGYLSLKERREAAAKLDIDDDSVADFVHRAGGAFEKDYSELKQAAIIGGTAAVTAAIGAVAVPTLTASISSLATAGAGAVAGAGATAGAGAGAVAAAGVNITAKGLGALLGLVPLGVGGYLKDKLKDKGDVEARVYSPDKKVEPPKEDKQEPQKEIQTVIQTVPQACVFKPEEEHKVVEKDYCSHKVQRGDNWTKVALAKYRVQIGTDANGNPVTRPVTQAEALKIAHELKLAHGIERKDFNKLIFPAVGEELRLFDEFEGLYHPELKGKKFIVDCDAKTDGKADTGKPKGQYKKWNGQYKQGTTGQSSDSYWYEDCSGNKSNIFSTKEARDKAMQEEIDRINSGN